MQQQWSGEWLPALEHLLEFGALTGEHQRSLGELQSLCDEIELRTVRDDTVARNVERYAWFRLLEKLQTTAASDLQAASTGRVGYVQLYKTPHDYRGQLVTVRGAARLPGGGEGRAAPALWAGGTRRPPAPVVATTPPPHGDEASRARRMAFGARRCESPYHRDPLAAGPSA